MVASERDIFMRLFLLLVGFWEDWTQAGVGMESSIEDYCFETSTFLFVATAEYLCLLLLS